MKCQRSVVDHREEVRLDLREVNSSRDRLDSGGLLIGIPNDHQLLYHLVITVMLTVEVEVDRMGALHPARSLLRDGVRGHINPIQH